MNYLTEKVPLTALGGFDSNTFEHLIWCCKMLDMSMEVNEFGDDVFCIVVETIDEHDGAKFIFSLADSQEVEELRKAVVDFKQNYEEYVKQFDSVMEPD